MSALRRIETRRRTPTVLSAEDLLQRSPESLQEDDEVKTASGAVTGGQLTEEPF
jgi:hypothetical protein